MILKCITIVFMSLQHKNKYACTATCHRNTGGTEYNGQRDKKYRETLMVKLSIIGLVLPFLILIGLEAPLLL